MLTIYIDLDGTVLDISAKYWRLHLDLTKLLGGPPIERERYWEMKRQGASIDGIWTDCPEGLWERYQEAWGPRIEDRSYLSYDRLHPGALGALQDLAEEHRLILATMRRDPVALRSQLAELGVLPLFNGVLCSADLPSKHPQKAALVRHGAALGLRPGMVVGDTEEDIVAGKELGVPTVGVMNGIRSRETLEPLEPTHLVDSLTVLPSILRQPAVMRERTAPW